MAHITPVAMPIQYATVLALLVSPGTPAVLHHAQNTRPNIVAIYADDHAEVERRLERRLRELRVQFGDRNGG